VKLVVALALVALAVPAGASSFVDAGRGAPPPTGPPPQPEPPARMEPERPRIFWRDSVALGSPSAGRLVRGVRLPAEGRLFFTWDPLLHRSPNRHWRRWGTDDIVRLVLRIVRAHSRAHPTAPRVGIGDFSRPRGGYFGPRHVSHQNGLDVDVYYPRLDRRERAPKRVRQIDRGLSQDLVDRFVRAGAVKVFVGPNTGLDGPPDVVQPLSGHDNHIHVRIAARSR
jgi:murein endopeptidase